MEQWKDIKNYEGKYQISNLGRVKSLKKWSGNKYNPKWVYQDRILHPSNNGNGYLIIGLKKNNIRKNYYIHRLVAEHFIDNPNNYKEVNHLDYNKENNKADNLEWCTRKENIEYSIENMKGRKSITHSNTNEKYITYRKRKNKYRVVIDRKEKQFNTLEEAINFRNAILKEVV